MTGTSYSLLVLELDDVVPRRDPAMPNLYVGITLMSAQNRVEFLASGKGPQWLQGRIRNTREDLCCDSFTMDYESAKAYKTATIAALRAEGYTVNRNTDIWTVYVIELDPTATKDPGAGYIYVGETKKDPVQRLAEHLNRSFNGKTRLFSAVVANHGKRLRMDLAPQVRYFDKESAKQAEAYWAEHMRSLGYAVKGGH